MNIIDTLRNRIATRLAPTQDNAVGEGVALARDFVRYGTGAPVFGSWSQLIMGENDKYTGYMYGAVTRRANKVVWLAGNNLRTRVNDATAAAAKEKKQTVLHPYLKLIDESPTFDNEQFWREVQSFLDLRGQYFLMAIRGKLGDTVGETKEFKLLRPYNITRVWDGTSLEVIGYTETRGGMYREIPPHMIIPMYAFNPNDEKAPFSMADAAKDAQFSIKEISEQIRTAASRNRKYPGVVLLGGENVALSGPQLENFKARLNEKAGSDEPLIAKGNGGINWADMQVDIRKSAVDVSSEVQLNALIAATGVSKTKFGIEQSGTTRDTAEVQDDQFILDQAIPALSLILGALNQDYKTHYPDEYDKYGYRMYVESPLKDDKDAEKADVDIRTSSFDLYTSLRNKGYDHDTAAAYASGEKDLSDIGEPTEEPKTPAIPSQPSEPVDPATQMFLQGQEHALTGRQINQIAARDFADMYDDLGINIGDLGCIMLDLEPIDLLKYVPAGEEDLLQASTQHDHTMGAVGEQEAHLTLLYGLLENGNAWKDKVDRLLDGWQPGAVRVESVDFFELPDSYAIIAHIQKTEKIVDGHERLTLLPHISTFSEYRPHMTLAYIHKDADPRRWVDALGKEYNGARLTSLGINYGDPEGGNNSHHHHDLLPAVRNDIKPSLQATIERQETALRNSVISVQRELVAAVLTKVQRNDFQSQDDIVAGSDKAKAEVKLEQALETFYSIIMPINASSVMSARAKEFGLLGAFAMDAEVEHYIKLTAARAAGSHINTVLEDLLATVQETQERLVQDELKRITPLPGQTDEEVLQLARKKALEGVGREQVAAAIRKEYGDTITKTRATTIARTETNRAFNRAQYEADRQFLDQNDISGRAYKKWVTRSDNPCAYCVAQSEKPAIPFDEPWARVGDVLSAAFKKKDGTPSLRQMQVGFEDCLAAEIHPNGHCTYRLIIQ